MRHNTAVGVELDSDSSQPQSDAPELGDLVEVPMSVDVDVFDGEASSLEAGHFVSFRYIAENNGLPISPKIS